MSEQPDSPQHEALLDSIRAAAEIEQQRVRQATEATLAQIEADTLSAIERIEADARGRATHTVDYESERTLSSVHIEGRRQLLQTKQKVLNEVLVRAEVEIANLPASENYANIIAALIHETLAVVGTDATVEVATPELALAKSALSHQTGAVTLKASEHAPGTVIATSSNGRRRVDNSLSTRLARAKVLFTQDISACLFPEQRGEAS